MIYNVVLISAVQQSDSVIHTYILFHILFHYGLSQDIEYSSLCYPVGPCWLLILYNIYNSLHLLKRIRFFYMFFSSPLSAPSSPNTAFLLSNIKHISHVYEYVRMSICTCLRWGAGSSGKREEKLSTLAAASKR